MHLGAHLGNRCANKSGYQGARKSKAAVEWAFRGLSEGASWRFSEQIEQADAWGRFAGIGAENPRMRGNCASAYRPVGPVEAEINGGSTRPTLSRESGLQE